MWSAKNVLSVNQFRITPPIFVTCKLTQFLIYEKSQIGFEDSYYLPRKKG